MPAIAGRVPVTEPRETRVETRLLSAGALYRSCNTSCARRRSLSGFVDLGVVLEGPVIDMILLLKINMSERELSRVSVLCEDAHVRSSSTAPESHLQVALHKPP